MNNLGSWTVFVAFIVALLALDLGVFNRRPRPVRFRDAMVWTVFWVAMAIAVGLSI
jgi:tellurite resistance protein TerC